MTGRMYKFTNAWTLFCFLVKSIILVFPGVLNHGRNFVVKCAGDSFMENQYSHPPDAEVKFCQYIFPILFLDVFSKKH